MIEPAPQLALAWRRRSCALTACGGGGDPLPAAPAGLGAGGDATPSSSARRTSRRASCSPRSTRRRWRPRASRSRASSTSAAGRPTSPALQDGSIDLIPEYTGVLLQYFDKTADRDRVRTRSTPRCRQALPDTADRAGQVRGRGQGRDRGHRGDRGAVRLTSIADLGPACGQLVFGGPPEFQTRPDGIPGIAETYGCTFKEFKALDAGGPLTVAALKNGTVQAADLFTTDPTIEDQRLRRARGPEEQLRGAERGAADQQGEGRATRSSRR